MPNFPFVVSDSLQIGTATISATGNAIVLPAGTTVGATPVATTTEVATGGGPKITNLQITDATWAVLDDTAVDTAGGYVLVTGTNFVSGALVYFNQTPATSVAFVSATALRVTVPALAAATYIVYVINPDGGTAIRVPGLTASANPAWQTASALPEQYDNAAITLTLVATEATSYTLTSGSLPPGLSLNANTGVITGTVTGVTVDTVYTFTVRATDAQLQDSPRTFTVTITVSDPYFKLTTLLLSGSAVSANTVVKDSSTNNFNLTVYGDSRASNFTPYGTGWSVYFDGTDDFITAPANAAFDFGTNDFTIECWIYYPVSPPSSTGYDYIWGVGANNTNGLGLYIQGGVIKIWNGSSILTTSSNIVSSVWYHITTVRTSSVLTVYLNGFSIGTVSLSSNLSGGSSTGFYIASWNNIDVEDFTGYISNLRIVKGSALYTANFTPATTNLTTVANTSLLTCNVNGFMDGSANNFTITRNGNARVVSFNPFNITNTGVNGSAYFDGTGDYLSAAYNSAFDLGSSNFTLEAWIYTSDSSSNYPSIVGRWQGSGTACWDLRPRSIERGNFLVFVYSTDGTNAAFVDSNGPALSDNAWHHVVAVRSGNNFALFVDGTRRNTANLSGVTIFNSASAPLNVGYDSWGTTYFTGYLSNVRVVKGTAVYDPTLTTLTVPTSPLTAIANTQLLTLQYDQPHNNHTFLDSSSNQFLITRNGNASQGTFSPFSQSGWSVYFDGSYDCIKVASDAAFGLGTGNFTIELWVNFDDYYAPQSRLAGQYTSGNTNGWQIYKNANSYNLIFNTNTADHITYNWLSVATNTWYHIAVVRSGTGTNQTIMYINGVNVATGTCSHSVGANQVVVGGLDWAASYSTKGYISSFRYSNIARTIVVPTVPYSSDANTLVLTCQSNRFIELSASRSITIAETPKTQAFSPFAPTAVYSPAVHGGSAYFDGTGDYLTTPNNVNLDLSGSINYTIEAWIYLTGYGSTADMSYAIANQFTSTGGSGYLYGIIGGGANQGKPSFYGAAGAVGLTATNTVPLNSWNHIAFVKSGTTYTHYLNGVSNGTTTTASTVNTSSEVFGVGKYITAGYTDLFKGYIADLRIIKGTAVYTANFTPPTAPLTAVSNTSLLLNFTDAAILDSAGRTVLETAADARTSSVVTKFTGGSMYFDGTGDAIIIRSSDLLTFGTGDWTVEFWVYHTSVSGQQTYLGDTPSATSGPYIYKDSSHKVGLYYSTQILTGTTTIAINTWYYIVLSRASGTVRLFINGIQETSASDTTNLSVAIQWIGGDTLPSGYLSGYMNDIRVTKGYARYTANFTAPTAPARLK